MKKTYICFLILSLFLFTGCGENYYVIPPAVSSNTLIEPVYDDALSPIINIASSQQAPTFDSTVMSYGFGNDVLASQDHVYIQIQLPHGYKQNSSIECHLHWLPSSTNTGAVNFSINYTFTDVFETQQTATYISAVASANGTALQHLILDFPTIENPNGRLSAIFKAKLMRESASASDTFTGTAYADFFDCHIQKSTIGSKYEYIQY